MKPSADIALFGATGFTGALVASALGEGAPPGAKLVLAGRSREKLETVRAQLPTGARFELLVADSADPASIERLAGSSRVVCTTVGPYAKQGLSLVQACAAAGTHYADLSGEVPFIRASIDAAHATAERTGAKIVHACGFDSVPSDLGVWNLHQVLRQRGASGRLKEVRFVLETVSGAFSGGTIASMLYLMETARSDKALRRLLVDPYSLSPQREREPDLGPQPDAAGVAYDAQLGRWTAPFLMAAINTRIVRRTNALLDYPYGRELRYSEVMATGRGLKGLTTSAGLTVGLGGLITAMLFKPARQAVAHFLPKPGEGPNAEKRRRGHFRIRLLAQTEEGASVTGLVAGQRDPGYDETAQMLSQSALALAFDGDQLPPRAGVLTPATALGSRLVERLKGVGMTFEAS